MSVFLVSACGVKGPLYLPNETDKNQTADTPKPAEADQEKTEQ
jgi:predicted small lipoprotein YifL